MESTFSKPIDDFLVNDLTTGGTTKALTAEMGKTLNSKIMIPDWSNATQLTRGVEFTATTNGFIVAGGYASSGTESTVSVTIGSFTLYQMAGVWQRATLIVPVKKGDKVTVDGNCASWDARHFIPSV